VTQSSDQALAKRILAGDRAACAEFIGRFHAPIYRLLVHLARDAHVAEDLAQETFLAAWKNISSFNAASSLNTWLHTIAYRKFIDANRRNERSVATTTATSTDRVQASTPGPYESALANDEARQLYRALDRLKPGERDVVVLHYLQGLSYEELAAVLGEPSGTVKWRSHQALENLRTSLQTKRKK
jgi:RNA polymerase sigma-70 factor (ECF subfamily)